MARRITLNLMMDWLQPSSGNAVRMTVMDDVRVFKLTTSNSCRVVGSGREIIHLGSARTTQDYLPLSFGCLDRESQAKPSRVKVESMEKIPGRSSQQWEGRKWTTARPPDHQDQLNPDEWDVEGWWEPRPAQNRPGRIGSRQKRKEKQRSGRRKSRGGVESSDLWDSDVRASTLTDHTRMI